ncbi:NusG domain II-containing protein [Alkalithermobacter paradoxus]|uniref:Uncharacterized protein n=1 Tax=Alkalithermobacter paradoxus TaxID=29349 RepID=A0A1V4I9R8_9FIRM|nr:hypothetical protein CLOTH_07690 [[Clostridium] thermoalcaliphilum]
MKKGDMILIAIICIVSFGGFLFLNFNKKELNEKYIEIVVDGQTYKKVYINNEEYNEKISVKTEFGENVVYIHDGGVEVESADCKDQICVKTGHIKRSGQIIACLPHKLYVKITGKGNEVDNIAY